MPQAVQGHTVMGKLPSFRPWAAAGRCSEGLRPDVLLLSKRLESCRLLMSEPMLALQHPAQILHAIIAI